MDVHSNEVRSYNMSQIKGTGTKPEMFVRKELHKLGFRFTIDSRNNKKLPGKPDLVFPKYNLCLFVHGCFWHKHEGCRHSIIPKSKRIWWEDKLNKNQQRDRFALLQLNKLNWRVFVVWECALKTRALKGQTISTLADLIPTQDHLYVEISGIGKSTCCVNPLRF